LRVASFIAHSSAWMLAGFATVCMAATSSEKPDLLQRPALSQTQIVFNYAGDLWSVDRTGGHAQHPVQEPAKPPYPNYHKK
jgi:tricorn protease